MFVVTGHLPSVLMGEPCGRGSSIYPSVKQFLPDFDTQCTCLVALSGGCGVVLDPEPPMSQAAAAHRAMAASEHVGKILLRPN